MRVVDRGAVQIDGARTEGPVLDRLVGLPAPALVPVRLNTGRAFVIADGIEHEVTPPSFAPFDRAGLVHRDSRAPAQAAELARRRALADPTANPFEAECEQAEKGPPMIGSPAEHARQPGAVARLIGAGAAAPDPAPSAQHAEWPQRLRNRCAARADAIRADETFDA